MQLDLLGVAEHNDSPRPLNHFGLPTLGTECRIAQLTVTGPDDEMITACADLRTRPDVFLRQWKQRSNSVDSGKPHI